MTRLFSILVCLATLASAAASSKRGLVHIANQKSTQDDSIWTQPHTDLTWYYNYGPSPSTDFDRNKLQFVPMLWGASTTNSGFTDTVQSLARNGYNITHVLGFNEPDEAKKNGGSDTDASTAAASWIREIEPLKKNGIKLGGPAVTGSPRGLNWLADFFKACKGGCTVDFLPLHWYGDFQGMASFIGQAREKYPNTTLWMTEFAMPKESLNSTQGFYNSTTSYLDSLEYLARYSYFGAFRSDASNVGPNVAMLNKNGDLTDIGSWYLGPGATGRKPSAAGRASPFNGWILILALIAYYLHL